MGLGFRVSGSGGSTCHTFAEIEKSKVECCLLVCNVSNSEYVRCLHLTGPQTLYVATNQGHIHHVELPETGSEIWTTLTDKDCVGPIVCMDLLLVRVSPLTEDPNDGNFQADEVIAFGNGLGTVTVLGLVRRRGTQPQIEWHSTWLADHERQLLGVFFCKSFGRRFISLSSHDFSALDQQLL